MISSQGTEFRLMRVASGVSALLACLLMGCETAEETALVGGLLGVSAFSPAANAAQAAALTAASTAAYTTAQIQGQKEASAVAGKNQLYIIGSAGQSSVGSSTSPALSPQGFLVGATVVDLEDSWRSRYNIPASISGVVIIEVGAYSQSYALGFREGLVIQEVNGRPVSNKMQLEFHLREATKEGCQLTVWSAQGTQSVSLWEQTEAARTSEVSQPRPNTSTGLLSVSAEDDTFEVFVDGKFKGNTPAKLKLAEGMHVIEVKKPGFKDYKRELEVSEGAELSIKAVLDKE